MKGVEGFYGGETARTLDGRAAFAGVHLAFHTHILPSSVSER